jgi:hypothetical protein
MGEHQLPNIPTTKEAYTVTAIHAESILYQVQLSSVEAASDPKHPPPKKGIVPSPSATVSEGSAMLRTPVWRKHFFKNIYVLFNLNCFGKQSF